MDKGPGEDGYQAWQLTMVLTVMNLAILDPKDVYGPDFPGETFRVLKEKEEREYGE